MFEAEIKFVAGPGFTPRGERLPDAVYDDVYFDTPDGALGASGRELRLRSVAGRVVLTAKAAPFDAGTASKPEFETVVSDRTAMAAVLAALGYVARVSLSKRCRRFHDAQSGLRLEVTVVTVDFDPRTFVEIEHPAAGEAEARAALPVIRAYAASCGLIEECAEAYTDLALTALARRASPARA